MKNTKSYLIYGHGLNDFKDRIKINGKNIREYELWSGMIERAYSDKKHSAFPTYKECEVEPFLLSFTNFYNFVRSLKGFGEVDEKGRPFQMDKDLLVKGNKTYGVDTVCFVPNEINGFLTHKKLQDGGLPTGVCWHKGTGKYRTKVRFQSKDIHLGYYDTPEEAFSAYKCAKEDQAKLLAEKWKDKIDPRVYDALMNYTVSIND